MNALMPLDYHATLAPHDGGMMPSLPSRYRARQLAYILKEQNPDGGFSGRAAESDPYYTSFALRSAALLGCEDRSFWQRASRYLRTCATAPTSVVDAFNLLHSIQIFQTHEGDTVLEGRVLSSIRSLLDACQSDRGGFAIVPGGETSVYQTFLAALSHQMIGSFARGDRNTLDFLSACRSADGGFTDKPGCAERGGTNPTSAAVALLYMHEALESRTAEGAVAFVSSMQRDDGGLAAHWGAPVSDLMSTYTGLLTLDKLHATGAMKLGPVGRFVREMGSPAGGFRATACDDIVDVEYTYYGLGTLALLTILTMPKARDSSDTGRHPSNEESDECHEVVC